MKIPNSFKLFATTITVVVEKWDKYKLPSLGMSIHHKATIKIASDSNGESLSDNFMIDTFYHEKVHMILDTMYEHKLSENEKFVEVFSRLLRQSDETSEY